MAPPPPPPIAGIFFDVVQGLLAIFLLFLLLPIIQVIVFNVFYWLIGMPLGLQPNQVGGFFNYVFFPGFVLKLLLRASIVPMLGGNTGTNLGMNFKGVYAYTWVDLDEDLLKEFIFVYSPYLLVFVNFLIIMFYKPLLMLLTYNGVPLILAIVIVVYLFMSIIITGFPTPQDTYAFFVLLARDFPMAIVMTFAITVNSLLLIPYFGLDIATTIAFIQFVVLLVGELRVQRILRILRNPEDNAEEYLNYVDLGII